MQMNRRDRKLRNSSRIGPISLIAIPRKIASHLHIGKTKLKFNDQLPSPKCNGAAFPASFAPLQQIIRKYEKSETRT